MLKKLSFFLIVGAVAIWFWSKGDSEHDRQASQTDTTQNETPKGENENGDETVKDAAVTTEKEEEKNQPIYSETDFINRYPGDWKFRRTDRGKIYTITGDLIPNVGSSKEEAFKFVLEMKDFLAKGDFTLEAKEEKASDTKHIQSFDVVQKAEGFDVYQGTATVFGSKKDGSAYLLNNRLKDIQPFETNVVFDVNQATQKLQSEYDQVKTKIPTPVVFADDNGTTELAWVFTTKKEFENFEVLVSAQSGDIIYRESRTRKD